MADPVIIFGLGTETTQTTYILEIFKLSAQYQVAGFMVQTSPSSSFSQLSEAPVMLWDKSQARKWQSTGITKAMVVHHRNLEKAALIAKVRDWGFELVNAIHPRAYVATSAHIGVNVIINAQTAIQPYAVLGNGVMVHAGVIVDHHSVIEDYANLAPGAALAGWVHVKEGAYIYTNATVIPTRKIGRYAVVGAGAVVLQDVPDYAVVVGNPARIIKYLPGPD